MKTTIQRGIVIATLMLLITMSVSGMATNVGAKNDLQIVAQTTELDQTIIGNGDDQTIVIVKGAGRHLGHYSPLDKWTMIHRDYTDYYSDPNDQYVYEAFGRVQETEKISWIAGVDIAGTADIFNLEYYEETGLPKSFDYQDSDGEQHHVELTYDEDEEVISYTDTGPDGTITEVEINSYDAQGRVRTYTEVTEKKSTKVTVGYGDGNNITSYREAIIIKVGSTTFMDFNNIDGIYYNELGQIEGYTRTITNELKTSTITITTFDYDKYGRVVGTREDTWSSDSPTPNDWSRTETNYSYNEFGRILGTLASMVTNSEGGGGLVEITETLYEYGGLGEVTREESETWNYGVDINDSDDDTAVATTREYNRDGLCVGSVELTFSKGSSLTHLFEYNNLGQVMDEMIIDHETGISADADELRRLLGEDSSDEDLAQFLQDFSSGELVDYLDINKSGEDSGKRDNRSLQKKINIKTFNIYKEDDYEYFAGILREWTGWKDHKITNEIS